MYKVCVLLGVWGGGCIFIYFYMVPMVSFEVGVLLVGVGDIQPDSNFRINF